MGMTKSGDDEKWVLILTCRLKYAKLFADIYLAESLGSLDLKLPATSTVSYTAVTCRNLQVFCCNHCYDHHSPVGVGLAGRTDTPQLVLDTVAELRV